MKFNWVVCDSKADLEARMQARKHTDILPKISSAGANTWGYLSVVLTNGEATIPIGYSDAGLTPEAAETKNLIIVGVTNEVVAYNKQTKREAFRHAMPTVFHEFVLVEDGGLVVQDETGFLRLSLDGRMQWERLFSDVIDSVRLTKNQIVGKTSEGLAFAINVEDGALENCPKNWA